MSGHTRTDSDPYPQHIRLQIYKPHADIIAGFLEWLFDRRFHIGELDREEHDWCGRNHCFPDHRGIERWLAEYFEIDLDELDREKRRMLKEIRDADAQKEKQVTK